MATPVVVSRIQNRRGTQDQFTSLYPPGFDGNSGYDGIFNQSVFDSVTVTSDGATVTVLCDGTKYPVDTLITVSGVSPTVYNGEFVITSSTPTSITYSSTATGVITTPGLLYPSYTSTLFPNVLLPGEIALCTDSRRVFVGNLNGGYVELVPLTPQNEIQLMPLMLTLVPTASWSPIISFEATPFYKISYDITDAVSPGWNTTGPNFGRNGTLEITAINTLATLNDVMTEINNSAPADISFKADLVGADIEISYKHNFPTNLTFSTSSIHWVPF